MSPHTSKFKIAFNARRLLHQNRTGVLSTFSVDVDGYPFGSSVEFMLYYQGRPVIYISRIAQHTKNIKANPKVCLTVKDEAISQHLEGGRVSLLGDAQKVPENLLAKVKERYFRYFPSAKTFEDAHDFDFYFILPKRARFIDGFAKIYWIEENEFLLAPNKLPEMETAIIDHMNKDHKPAILNYCQFYHGLTCKEAKIFAINPEGFDVRTDTTDLYFSFEKECANIDDFRQEMTRMANEAKALQT